jgi:hypothetical protein
MKNAMLAVIFAVVLIAPAAAWPQAVTDPYASLTPEVREVLKPGVERYIHDQIKQDWADLWEIQDQTSDLKNELLLGNRTAPDMTKEQFVSAMREVIATGGHPRMRTFDLRVARADKGNYIVIGCASAVRELWHQMGFVIFAAKIADGKPKFDIWSMTSDSCSDKQ